MFKYLIAGAAVVAVVAAAYAGFGPGRSDPQEQDVVNKPADTASFVKEGVIAKDLPDLTAGVWYFVYEGSDAQAYAVELIFDEDSICAGRAASGPCNPEIFVHGRGAMAEGTVEGNTVRVQKLTFTQPL